jgi:Ca2+-transporting ATPase
MFYFRELVIARTAAFCALVFAQLAYVFRCAANRGIFRKCIRNPWLPAAVLCSLAMQLAVVYLPFLQNYFRTSPLNAAAWVIVLSTIGLAIILQQIFQAISALMKKG